jgi:hypothetical protein
VRAFFANTETPWGLTIYIGTEDAADQICAYVVAAGFDLNIFDFEEGKHIDPVADYSREINEDEENSDCVWILIRRLKKELSPFGSLLNIAPTTASLNFFTWNKAYALYTRETFLKNETYLLRYLSTRAEVRNSKEISEQGFTNHTVHTDLKNDPIAGIRRVGDKQTWVYDLNTTGIAFDAAPVPDSVVETATFKVCRSGLGGEWFCICNGDRYSLRAISRFSHSIFRHIYTTLSEEDLAWHDLDEHFGTLRDGLGPARRDQ